MAINTWFANAIPHFSNYDWSNSIIKKWDRQWTIDGLMNKMELMVQHDDYMRSQNRNYKASKSEDEEFNKYKKQLKDLWVSFDDFRWWYYERHPTPEMEARQNAWDAMNKAFYDTLWPSPSQLKQEEQKLQDVINNSPNDFVKKSALDKLDSNRAKQKELQNQNKWIKFTPSKRKYRFTKPDNRVVL